MSHEETLLSFWGYLLDLREQVERGELLLPVIFTVLVLCSVLLYLKVSLMDPGFVKSEEEVKVYYFTNVNKCWGYKIHTLFSFSPTLSAT